MSDKRLFTRVEMFSHIKILIPLTMATDSKNEWNPVSRLRFDEILKEEVAGLPPDALKIYENTAVSVVEQPCYRDEQYGIEHVLVVARAGARLLLFDDVED